MIGDLDDLYRRNVGDGCQGGAVDVESIVRRQDGVISRGQAVAAGMSADQVDRRLASGRWRPVLPRVYLAQDCTLTVGGRVRAAALWAGRDAVVSGLAAAWWHGLLDRCPAEVAVTVPPSRRPRAPDGVRVRRRQLAVCDRVLTRAVPVTSLPLTVLEAAVELGDAGPQFMDRALQRHVGFRELSQAHTRNLGNWGSAQSARLLACAADGAASEGERRLVALLQAAGISGWRLHLPVRGYEVDLAFPAARAAVEVDGWAWRHDVGRFGADRAKQNALVLEGWTVLRFTWHDLVRRPDRVLADIAGALEFRAAA